MTTNERYWRDNESGHTSTGETAGKVQESLNAVKEKAAATAERAKEAAGRGKERTGEALEHMGTRLRERTEAMGGVRGAVGTRMATGAEKAGTYLRENAYGDIWEDIDGWIHHHPMQAMFMALAFGYWAGWMWHHDRHHE